MQSCYRKCYKKNVPVYPPVYTRQVNEMFLKTITLLRENINDFNCYPFSM